MPNLTRTRSSSVEETISSLADILLSSADCPVEDLTEQLQPMGKYPFAGGGYSDVYKYTTRSFSLGGRTSGSQVFAVKAANAKLCVGERRKSMRKLRREFEVWASLQHVNVMKLHGVVRREGNPYLCLVSDYMENGTALQYLRKNPEANVIRLICDIAKGLAYLHGKDVVHGDLKENNVLVGGDGRGRLADFGLSRLLGPDGLVLEVSTSDGDRNSRWTAVEYFNFSGNNVPPQSPTREGDVWSLGCTILQLFSGKFPFYDSRDAAVTIRLSQGESPTFPPDVLRPNFEKYRRGITAYCQLCWVKDPLYRPGINVLEPIICSYCAEAGCDEPGAFSGPSPTSDETSYHGIGNANPVNGEQIELSTGLRSRSSSVTTIVDSRDEEYFQEPFSAEPREILNGFSRVNQSEAADTTGTAPGPSIPLFEFPPPPPPSIESILHYRNKSAPAILTELCQVRTGFRVAYEDGGSTGPSHVRTHTIICLVNDEQCGVGRIQGTKKQAKERAAMTALGQLYLEHPDYFPALRYLPILQSHLGTSGLGHRVTWIARSTPDPQDPRIWEHRRTIICDGTPTATGVGNTDAMAEESAARNVALLWQHAFASSA